MGVRREMIGDTIVNQKVRVEIEKFDDHNLKTIIGASECRHMCNTG